MRGDAIGGLLLGLLLDGSLLRLFGSRFLLVLSVGRLWCGKVEEMIGGTQHLKLCSSAEGIAFLLLCRVGQGCDESLGERVSFVQEGVLLRISLGKTKEGTKGQIRKWVFRKFITYCSQTGLYTKTQEYLTGAPDGKVKGCTSDDCGNGTSDGIARNGGRRGDLKLTDGESDNGLGLD